MYHWSSPMSTSDIRHAVEHAGWRCIVLDTIEISDRAGLRDAVATACGSTASHGNSLADLLQGVHDRKGRSTLIVWVGWASFAKRDPAAAREAVDDFADRARRQPAFAVVLHGPGPDLELAELDRRPEIPG